MTSQPIPLDGDVVINNEDDISLGELINALYADPRFIAMIRNLVLLDARRKGNSFGLFAQAPTAVVNPRRIS